LKVTAAGETTSGTEAAIRGSSGDQPDQPWTFLARYLNRYVLETWIDDETVYVKASESAAYPIRSVHRVPFEASSYCR